MKNEYKVLDLTQWPRQQHFEFFKGFSQPFMNICCDLDAKTLFQYCRAQQIGFFSAYMFLLMKSINRLEPFKYRLVAGEVRIYQEIAISVAIMAEDQSFRFCTVPYADDFSGFIDNLAVARETALSQPFFSTTFYANASLQSTIHASVTPWISFTGLTHAVDKPQDPTGIPLIVFGKMRRADHTLPLAVDAHHALMDVLHVGQLVEMLQGYFDRPEQVLGEVL